MNKVLVVLLCFLVAEPEIQAYTTGSEIGSFLELQTESKPIFFLHNVDDATYTGLGVGFMLGYLVVSYLIAVLERLLYPAHYTLDGHDLEDESVSAFSLTWYRPWALWKIFPRAYNNYHGWKCIAAIVGVVLMIIITGPLRVLFLLLIVLFPLARLWTTEVDQTDKQWAIRLATPSKANELELLAQFESSVLKVAPSWGTDNPDWKRKPLKQIKEDLLGIQPTSSVTPHLIAETVAIESNLIDVLVANRMQFLSTDKKREEIANRSLFFYQYQNEPVMGFAERSLLAHHIPSSFQTWNEFSKDFMVAQHESAISGVPKQLEKFKSIGPNTICTDPCPPSAPCTNPCALDTMTCGPLPLLYLTEPAQPVSAQPAPVSAQSTSVLAQPAPVSAQSTSAKFTNTRPTGAKPDRQIVLTACGKYYQYFKTSAQQYCDRAMTTEDATMFVGPPSDADVARVVECIEFATKIN